MVVITTCTRFNLLFSRWTVGLSIAVISLFLSSLTIALISQRHHTPVPVTIYELKEGLDGLWVKKHSTSIEEHVFYLCVQDPLILWMSPCFWLDERWNRGSANILVIDLTILRKARLYPLKASLENRISEPHGMLVYFLVSVLFPKRASTEPPVRFLRSLQFLLTLSACCLWSSKYF